MIYLVKENQARKVAKAYSEDSSEASCEKYSPLRSTIKKKCVRQLEFNLEPPRPPIVPICNNNNFCILCFLKKAH